MQDDSAPSTSDGSAECRIRKRDEIQALLDSNAHQIWTLNGLTSLRGGDAPSEVHLKLLEGCYSTLATVVQSLPPKVFASHAGGDEKLMQFVSSARILGLLPTKSPKPPPPPLAPLPMDLTQVDEETGAPVEAGPARGGAAEGLPGAGPAPAPASARERPPPGPSARPASSRAASAASAGDSAGGKDAAGTGAEGATREKRDEENVRLTDETGRVTLSKRLPGPPPGFMGDRWHEAKSLEGVRFYGEAAVVDPDNPKRILHFDVSDRGHCACFNMSQQACDGSLKISYSNLYALYQFPDGEMWAEHGYFYDLDDLKEHSETEGISWEAVIKRDHDEDKELIRLEGRFHTHIADIEDECWVYDKQTYLQLKQRTQLTKKQLANAYFWRVMIDATTMDVSSAAAIEAAIQDDNRPENNCKLRVAAPSGKRGPGRPSKASLGL